MVGRIGIGLIPLVGGPGVELFNAVVSTPLEQRNQKWRQSVGERLNELGSIEALQSNEVFITTLMKASAAAVREHQEEKLEALRNAVLNAAGPAPLDESRQQMFVHLVERLTVWHLRLLRLVMSPTTWFRNAGRRPPEYGLTSSILGLVNDAYPELRDQRDLVELLFAELKATGLCTVSQVATMMSATGALENRGTTLGGQFIAFISAPPPRAQ